MGTGAVRDIMKCAMWGDGTIGLALLGAGGIRELEDRGFLKSEPQTIGAS